VKFGLRLTSASSALILACAMASVLTAAAVAQSYHEIKVPGSFSTSANGINNKFQVVGFYGDISTGNTRGFLLSNGKYTNIDFPRATGFTAATGINDSGEIVGYFSDSATHGFIDQRGAFTQLDYPGAISTQAQGVNRAGEVVGSYTDANKNQHGFKYVQGAWTTIDIPNATATFAQGVDSLGNIVGQYNDANGFHGFLLKTTGEIQTINFPGTQGATIANGINDKGQIVGIYTDPTILKIEGYELTNGQFQQVRYPGASTTFPQGVNNTNFVVGSWFTSMGQGEGFVRTP
jgi:probable HAF family extracellular repeat protein